MYTNRFNDYFEAAHVPNSDTIYFSALDTTTLIFNNNNDDQQQENINEYALNTDTTTTSSSSSSSSASYESSVHYYSSIHRPLRRINDDENDDYTSLRIYDTPEMITHTKEEHKINYDEDDERLDERTVILTDETKTTTENDSVIASYAQLEELERVGRRSLDYVRYSECLERLEKTIFESFERKVRTRKMRHYNIDQTIEETLEETDYENVLDDLIKKMAKQSSVASSSSSSSSSKSSIKYPKRLVVEEETGLNACAYSNGQSEPAICLAENDLGVVSTRRSKTSRVDHFEILDECSSEYPLLEHAFNLAKKCNLAWTRFRCDQHYVKFVALSNQTTCVTVRSVANVFMSLLRLDFNELLQSFVSIPLKDRWNVLKNLIYYSVKLTLSTISEFFIDDVGEAFSQIIQSIYSYVRNFNRIILN